MSEGQSGRHGDASHGGGSRYAFDVDNMRGEFSRAPGLRGGQYGAKAPDGESSNLPLFLRMSMASHPGNSKCAMVFAILTQPAGSIAPTLAMGWMLKSAALGIVFGSCLCVGGIMWVLSAPRMEGVLLELIFEDPQELNKKLLTAYWGQFFFGNFIFMPTVFFFLVLPCVDSDLFGGRDTKTILLTWFGFAWLCSNLQPITFGLMQLPAQTKKIWSHKIRAYFETLTHIIVDKGSGKMDMESGNAQTVEELISREQRAVESWSRSVNNATERLNTSGILMPFSMAVTAFVMLTYLPADASYSDRIVGITVNVLFIFMLSIYFVISLYGVAGPNLSFERYKLERWLSVPT